MADLHLYRISPFKDYKPFSIILLGVTTIIFFKFVSDKGKVAMCLYRGTPLKSTIVGYLSLIVMQQRDMQL